MPLQLGPFEISDLLGTGGMGQVYLGRHIEENVSVAIKVLTPKATRNEKYQAYFRNEVRAVAGLSHPNIISVYDFGRVSASAADRSEGRLNGGSPWLAMELADHGSLLDWRGTFSWYQVRQVLTSLLDALAHAHARGVIHRDLKGANVLLSGVNRQIKLADFGLASAISDPHTDEEQRPIGTPWYMAPEQFAGSRRDQGPWTDLYALGCLAWVLTTGLPPFPGKTWKESQNGHILRPPPALSPRFAVPNTLEIWLNTLLEKRPADRFCSAADAAWALLNLPDPDHSESSPLPLLGDEPPSSSLPHCFSFHTIEKPDNVILPDSFPRPRALNQWPLPPLPSSWRQPIRNAFQNAPLGVGLGLFGLRSIPVVGRTEQRDQMWDELKRVRERGRPSALVLQGAIGSGKSRLAEWFTARASELGAAQILRATHDRTAAVSDGLSAMISRHLRAFGLGDAALAEHVRYELESLNVQSLQEQNALTSLLLPLESRFAKVRFQRPTERFIVIQRYLERLCAERPVIVWLDDAHRGLDALAFASYFLQLDRHSHRPVLFVLTVHQEDVGEHAIVASQLNQLLDHPSSTSIELPALTQEQQVDLIRKILGLDPKLAQQIASRTGGNPLFAVQLVGNLVQNGQLIEGSSGYLLRDGAELSLPDDLQQVWNDRLKRLLRGRPDTEEMALELAAVLGIEVDTFEWEPLCGRLHIPVPTELIDDMIAQRLAHAHDGGPLFGWGFANGMFRETLQSRTKTSKPKRWRQLNLLVANMLKEEENPRLSARIGRHYLRGGDAQKALRPLLQAARSKTIDPRAAELLLIERETALQTLSLPQTAPDWAEGWLTRAQLLLSQGREQDAARWASQALENAEEFQRHQQLAEAYNILSEVGRIKGRFGQSLQFRRKAVQQAIAARSITLQSQAMAGIGHLYMDVGNWNEARRVYEQALTLAQHSKLNDAAAECLISLGYIAFKTEDNEGSDDYFRQAENYINRSSSQLQRAHFLNALAELARKRKEYAVAEDYFTRSLEHYSAAGTRAVQVIQLNLGMTQVLQGKYTLAQKTLESVLQEESTGPQGRAFIATGLCTLLPCLAALREWPLWYKHLERIRQTLSGDMFIDDDTIDMLELAARIATQAKENRRAKAAFQIVLAMWQSTGHENRASAIEAQLARL